jgi:hypothetical protein
MSTATNIYICGQCITNYFDFSPNLVVLTNAYPNSEKEKIVTPKPATFFSQKKKKEKNLANLALEDSSRWQKERIMVPEGVTLDFGDISTTP